MDEEALRAMMPMAFGKAPKPRPGAKAAAAEASSSSSAAAAAPLQGIAWESPTAAAAAARSGPSVPRGPMRPAAGPQKRPAAEEDDDEDDDDGLTPAERAANREAERRAAENGGDDDDDDSDGSVDLGPEPEGDEHGLPVAQCVQLSDHTKAVSALAIDASGARVATGSFDYDVKLWDFGGMTASRRPFKSFEPAGTYWVHDVAWSAHGEQLLVASGTAQPKLFDRDGAELATFRKGDPYIRDMNNTNGHVAELTACAWHPTQPDTFLTSSADSSVRFWHAEEKQKQARVIVVRSKERGTRTKVTAMGVSHDGRTLGAACLDGALHLWSTSSNLARPSSSIEGAHERNTETSAIVFSRDGRTVATRGGDDTVKLWDARSFKRPLAVRSGLRNEYAQTSLIFSLDERTLLTGTSAERTRDPAALAAAAERGEAPPLLAGGGGAIEVLSREDLAPLRRIPVSGEATSVVRLAYAPKINQLFASTSTGSVSVFFDAHKSSRGALLAVAKRAKVRPTFESFGDLPIITPGAENPADRGMGMSQAAKKRRLEKMRADPQASRMPERPLSGPGKGGRIGAAATQHMVQNIYRGNTRDEDPREALLKYADKAESDPKWTAAWAKNQPKPVFAAHEEDEEEGGK